MDEDRSASPEHLRDQIEMIATHEQEFLAQRTRLERLGDRIGAFTGSLAFAALLLSLVGGWLLINLVRIGRVLHFDAYPFSLLGTVVSARPSCWPASC